METVATAKGQVVIPVTLRRKYGIKEGTRINVTEDNGCIILQPLTPAYVRKVRGMLKGAGALKMLLDERKRDRES